MSEKLARQFHEAYERLAPKFGYETRTETREFDPYTPNGRLMIAVCSEIDRQHQAEIGQLRNMQYHHQGDLRKIERLRALLRDICEWEGGIAFPKELRDRIDTELAADNPPEPRTAEDERRAEEFGE